MGRTTDQMSRKGAGTCNRFYIYHRELDGMVSEYMWSGPGMGMKFPPTIMGLLKI